MGKVSPKEKSNNASKPRRLLWSSRSRLLKLRAFVQRQQSKLSPSSTKSYTDTENKRAVILHSRKTLNNGGPEENAFDKSPSVPSPVNSVKQNLLFGTPKTPRTEDCESELKLESLPIDLLETKMEKGKTVKTSSNFFGHHLFTKKYFKNKKEQKGKGKAAKEGKSFAGVSVQLRDAWNRLREKEKAEYSNQAKEIRGSREGKKYILPFLTRCAPKQFITVCDKIKTKPELMERLKAIGFDKLVHVYCTQINHDLCAQFMRCFNPATNVVTIRGETRVLAPIAVQQIMGLPFGGQKIEVNARDKDLMFVNLYSLYKGLTYQKIGERLMGKSDDNFELYFVLFALGTLLTPSSSIYVTECVLKCLKVTYHAIGAFDWCSLILTELSDAVGGFKRELVKGIGKERKIVGGCLYFLMEIRRTYYSIMGMVGSEFLALQNRLQVKGTTDEGYEEEPGGAGLFGHAGSDFDIAESMAEQVGTEHAAEEDMDEGEKLEIGEIQEEQKGHDILRSQQTKTPSWVVSSRWINQNLKQKGKHGFDKQARLFDLCTQRPKNEEGDEVFVELYDYYITLGELYLLRLKGWLNDAMMSMVAKALVAEQYEQDGRVTRHVFTSHFMSKIVDNPSKWSLEENETQILPEHVGYNIGDCEFIFGPTLFLDHWSCYVFHTQTMRFYALDSLVNQAAEQRTNKKSKTTRWTDPKQHISNRVV